MAVKTFSVGETLTASDTNTYLNNGGLVYVKSQTIGTAVSSVAVTGAFSATYDNYRIIINGGVASASNSLALTLGATATGYYDAAMYMTFGSTTLTGFSNSNAASWASVVYGTANTLHGAIELHDPFNAKNTTMESRAIQATTTGFSLMTSGYLANTTSYTDFTLTATGGTTLTGGTITVYGYRKA
jgi:hypothetical protein